MNNVSFFELDKELRLIKFNQQFADDVKAKESELIGKTALEIPSKKPFHKAYDLGNREAEILQGHVSIRKEAALLANGIQSVIISKKCINHNAVYIRGFYFKLHDNSTEVVGKKVVIHNYFKPMKLSLLNFYVVTLKCAGLSNADIAKRVSRAESTIRNMVLEILCEFGVYDVVSLAKYFTLGEWLTLDVAKLLQEKFNTNSFN